MIEKIFDGLLALVFTALTVFSAPAIYCAVKRAALVRVSQGLHSTYRLQRLIDPNLYTTGRGNEWETHAAKNVTRGC